MKMQHLSFLLLQAMVACRAILHEELGKDLPSNYNNHDILARRRRPLGGNSGSSGCNFNGLGKPKGQGSGRTFFDLQFFSVQYQDNYNINCGGGHPSSTGGGHGGQGGGYKPIVEMLGGQGGHKPIFSGSGNGGGLFANKPSRPLLSSIVNNRPLQGLFGQTQSQSQTGIVGDTVSSIVSLLPKPQDIGQGLGDGISSFIQTVPQIGQSFLSLLPSFENFQLPSLPSFPSLGQGSQSAPISSTIPTSTPSIVTPAAPDLVTEPTIDPDDIIYNDSVKPVNEDPDVVTGGNKLPPGAYFNRYRTQNRYQSFKKYQDQKLSTQTNQNKFHYQQYRPLYGQREPRLRPDLDIFSEYEGRHGRDEEQSGSRSFRFPT